MYRERGMYRAPSMPALYQQVGMYDMPGMTQPSQQPFIMAGYPQYYCPAPAAQPAPIMLQRYPSMIQLPTQQSMQPVYVVPVQEMQAASIAPQRQQPAWNVTARPVFTSTPMHSDESQCGSSPPRDNYRHGGGYVRQVKPSEKARIHMDPYMSTIYMSDEEEERSNKRMVNKAKQVHRPITNNQRYEPEMVDMGRRINTSGGRSYKTRACRNMIQYNNCPYGDRCHFLHPGERSHDSRGHTA